MARGSVSRALLLKAYYPLLMMLGSVSKARKERFQSHVIGLNNKLVEKANLKTKRILLLLPHCLQMDECKIRLTHNIYNCKRCGKCEIKDLITIAEEHDLDLFVATGGTLARRTVTDLRPDAIVAVACERDLSSGIADAYPVPAIGIPNMRPFGPCINTKVDLDKVREAIRSLSTSSAGTRPAK